MKREHFSVDSRSTISYYMNQPLAILVEPLIVKYRIKPDAITGVRAIAAVVTAFAIIMSAVDA